MAVRLARWSRGSGAEWVGEDRVLVLWRMAVMMDMRVKKESRLSMRCGKRDVMSVWWSGGVSMVSGNVSASVSVVGSWRTWIIHMQEKVMYRMMDVVGDVIVMKRMEWLGGWWWIVWWVPSE